QVAGVAGVGVGGGAVGGWAGARAMFLSDHDLWALGVILVAAGTVAVVSALFLGRRVGAASEALVGVARRLGDADAPPAGPGPTAPLGPGRLPPAPAATPHRLAPARARVPGLASSRRALPAGGFPRPRPPR